MGLRRPCDVVGGALGLQGRGGGVGLGVGQGGCAEKATGLKRTSTARLAGNAQGAQSGAGADAEGGLGQGHCT